MEDIFQYLRKYESDTQPISNETSEQCQNKGMRLKHKTEMK